MWNIVTWLIFRNKNFQCERLFRSCPLLVAVIDSVSWLGRAAAVLGRVRGREVKNVRLSGLNLSSAAAAGAGVSFPDRVETWRRVIRGQRWRITKPAFVVRLGNMKPGCAYVRLKFSQSRPSWLLRSQPSAHTKHDATFFFHRVCLKNCFVFTVYRVGQKPDRFWELITLWRLVRESRVICQKFSNFACKKCKACMSLFLDKILELLTYHMAFVWKTVLSTIRNDLLHEFIDKALCI